MFAQWSRVWREGFGLVKQKPGDASQGLRVTQVNAFVSQVDAELDHNVVDWTQKVVHVCHTITEKGENQLSYCPAMPQGVQNLQVSNSIRVLLLIS